MKQIKELEKRFIELYEEFKEIIPDTNNISLSVCEYNHRPGMHLYGFYHIGEECVEIRTIDDLIRLSILFRRFK